MALIDDLLEGNLDPVYGYESVQPNLKFSTELSQFFQEQSDAERRRIQLQELKSKQAVKPKVEDEESPSLLPSILGVGSAIVAPALGLGLIPTIGVGLGATYLGMLASAAYNGRSIPTPIDFAKGAYEGAVQGFNDVLEDKRKALPFLLETAGAAAGSVGPLKAAQGIGLLGRMVVAASQVGKAGGATGAFVGRFGGQALESILDPEYDLVNAGNFLDLVMAPATQLPTGWAVAAYRDKIAKAVGGTPVVTEGILMHPGTPIPRTMDEAIITGSREALQARDTVMLKQAEVQPGDDLASILAKNKALEQYRQENAIRKQAEQLIPETVFNAEMDMKRAVTFDPNGTPNHIVTAAKDVGYAPELMDVQYVLYKTKDPELIRFADVMRAADTGMHTTGQFLSESGVPVFSRHAITDEDKALIQILHRDPDALDVARKSIGLSTGKERAAAGGFELQTKGEAVRKGITQQEELKGVKKTAESLEDLEIPGMGAVDTLALREIDSHITKLEKQIGPYKEHPTGKVKTLLQQIRNQKLVRAELQKISNNILSQIRIRAGLEKTASRADIFNAMTPEDKNLYRASQLRVQQRSGTISLLRKEWLGEVKLAKKYPTTEFAKEQVTRLALQEQALEQGALPGAPEPRGLVTIRAKRQRLMNILDKREKLGVVDDVVLRSQQAERTGKYPIGKIDKAQLRRVIGFMDDIQQQGYFPAYTLAIRMNADPSKTPVLDPYYMGNTSVKVREHQTLLQDKERMRQLLDTIGPDDPDIGAALTEGMAAIERKIKLTEEAAGKEAKVLDDMTNMFKRFGKVPSKAEYRALKEKTGDMVIGSDMLGDYIDYAHGISRSIYLDQALPELAKIYKNQTDPRRKMYLSKLIMDLSGNRRQGSINSLAARFKVPTEKVSKIFNSMRQWQHYVHVGLNPAFVPVNLTNNLLTLGVVVGDGHMAKGFFQSMKQLQSLATDYESRGILSKADVAMSLRDFENGAFLRRGKKVLETLGKPAQQSELFNRVWAARSAELHGIELGKTGADLDAYMNGVVKTTNFGYGISERPIISNTPGLGLITQFKRFSFGYMNFLTQLFHEDKAKFTEALLRSTIVSGTHGIPFYSMIRPVAAWVGADLPEADHAEDMTGLSIGPATAAFIRIPRDLRDVAGPTVGGVSDTLFGGLNALQGSEEGKRQFEQGLRTLGGTPLRIGESIAELARGGVTTSRSGKTISTIRTPSQILGTALGVTPRPAAVGSKAIQEVTQAVQTRSSEHMERALEEYYKKGGRNVSGILARAKARAGNRAALFDFSE